MTSAGRAGGGGSWSQPLESSQSRTYCLSNDGCGPPGSYRSAGQNRDESGVMTSSHSMSSPPANPNSNFVSATKFEFGFAGGELMLCDEVMTPDSSRFWPADRYEPGGPQPSFDKQYVRDWLDSSGWDHE